MEIYFGSNKSKSPDFTHVSRVILFFDCSQTNRYPNDDSLLEREITFSKALRKLFPF